MTETGESMVVVATKRLEEVVVSFAGVECTVHREQYSTDRSVCLRLVEVGTGMPVATATLCVSGRWPLEWDEVLIKDFEENCGVLNALVDAGVVSMPHVHLDTLGRVKRVREPGVADRYGAVCKLLAV